MVTAIFALLKKQHVVTEDQLLACTSGVSLDELNLNKFTLFVGGKYYLKRLDSEGLTSSRNMVLEILSQGLVKKSELQRKVIERLAMDGHQVSPEDVKEAIKLITAT